MSSDEYIDSESYSESVPVLPKGVVLMDRGHLKRFRQL
jgi:hypothetical protein